MKENWLGKLRNKNGIILLLIIAIGILSVKNRDMRRTLFQNTEASLDTIQVWRDKYDRIIFEKNAVILSEARLKKVNDSLRELFRKQKPEIVVKWKTVYRDTAPVMFPGQQQIDTQQASVPFSQQTRWRKLSGQVKKEGIFFDEFAIYNSPSLSAGYKNGGLFRKDIYTVRITNDNPYISVSDIRPYRIEHREKWYKRWYLWGIAGLIAGWGISR